MKERFDKTTLIIMGLSFLVLCSLVLVHKDLVFIPIIIGSFFLFLIIMDKVNKAINKCCKKTQEDILKKVEVMLKNKDRINKKEGTIFWSYLWEDFQELKKNLGGKENE